MRNTLLIIGDSELDRAIFNEIFKKDYRVLRAATAYEGWTRCGSTPRSWL